MHAQEGSGASLRKGTAPSVRVLIPSPIGMLGVELTGPAVSRLRINPAETERATFTPLHQVDASDFLDEVFGRLSEYFAGARHKLDLEYDLAPCGLNVLARRVLRETAKIPYGKTRTCHGLAEAMGSPDAGDMVLKVLLDNPIPILIPCHRVLAGRSEIGVYVGGAESKLWLLELERQGEQI